MRVAIERVALRFRAPLVTSYGTLRERDLLLLRLRTADGLEGLGEAAPLEPYDGVALEDCAAALERCRPVLEAWEARAGGAGGSALLDACRERTGGLAQALAAIDMALWDLGAQREGRPVCELLAEDPTWAVTVNATIGAEDRARAGEEAARAAAAGFGCVKVKVGIGDDAGRVAAVRAAAGPGMAIRLDANGAWSVEEAEAALRHLSPAGLELVEEPVNGVDGLRALRERVPVRVAMDETAAEPGALASGAADAVCLKLARCGGISGTLAAAALVRTTGAEPYLASSFDGPVGIAAALHVAAALKPESPCGLATLGLFETTEEGFAAVDGAIAVPHGPGLGVSSSGRYPT